MTGGGHIDSPAGALIADPTADGQGRTSASTRSTRTTARSTGRSTSTFHGTNFKFKSTTIDWIVVDRPNAQVFGTGTVNNAGSYGFLVTVTDGDSSGGDGIDRFRIKIWDKNAGDAVVYDNVIGGSDDIDTATPQPLSGGNVTIHKAK